jgi:hypothetical protein
MDKSVRGWDYNAKRIRLAERHAIQPAKGKLRIGNPTTYAEVSSLSGGPSRLGSNLWLGLNCHLDRERLNFALPSRAGPGPSGRDAAPLTFPAHPF